MGSQTQSSVQNGQPQYPPFNPRTASYTLPNSLHSDSNSANVPPTSSALIYNVDSEDAVNGAGSMIGLTLEQYNAGQRSSMSPYAPLTTSTSNKRQLSHDQFTTPSCNHSDENGNNIQTQPKKRARKTSSDTTPYITRSKLFVLGESVFSSEDFSASLQHFKEISASHYLDNDDLKQVRDLLSWGNEEQRKWLAKLSPEQFGIVLLAERQNHDEEQAMVVHLDNTPTVQPRNPNSATSTTNSGVSPTLESPDVNSMMIQDGQQNFTNLEPHVSNQPQGNDIQNGINGQYTHHKSNMATQSNQFSFKQHFSLPAQHISFQQMVAQHPQAVQLGAHQGVFDQMYDSIHPCNTQFSNLVVGPRGQLLFPYQQVPLNLQQNMMGNMQPMQSSGAYQQQMMVNGQLMNVSLQPVFDGQLDRQISSHQLTPGAHSFSPQQNGTFIGHGFNAMIQQNSTGVYGFTPSSLTNNSNQASTYVLPTLTHAAKVAEAQLRAATMRRQHAALHACGLPIPNTPSFQDLPPLMLSGPGLGTLPGLFDKSRLVQRAGLVETIDGPFWEKSKKKNPGLSTGENRATGSPTNNSLAVHMSNTEEIPMQFSGISVANQAAFPQVGNGASSNQVGIQLGQSANAIIPGSINHNATNGTVPSFVQVQLPNSAGQLSIGPNAQGSTSPAGAANGSSSKTPKAKKTPRKKADAAASSSTPIKSQNALFSNSIFGPPTSQIAVNFSQPVTSFSAFQHSEHTSGPQVNPVSLDMPIPVSAATRSAVESFVTKLTFPPLSSSGALPATPSSTTTVNVLSAQVAPTASAHSAIISAPRYHEIDITTGTPPITQEECADLCAFATGVPSKTEIATESSVAPKLEPTADEATKITDAEHREIDDLFSHSDTPELEPSTLNDSVTPGGSEPADFDETSSDDFLRLMDTTSGFSGLGTYDESQPLGLGFGMAGDDPYDVMANLNFNDWIDFDAPSR